MKKTKKTKQTKLRTYKAVASTSSTTLNEDKTERCDETVWESATDRIDREAEEERMKVDYTGKIICF